MNKIKKSKQGISLIVLVITIIVIVILAVAVILSIANNNPIENANEAKFKSDVKSMQEELELIKAKNYAESNGNSYGTISTSDLTSLEKNKDKFVITSNGDLIYATNKLNENEKEWAKEIGIEDEGYYMLEEGKDGVTIEGNVIKTNWFNEETDASTIPESMKNVEKIIIPEGVIKIEASAFCGWKSITDVILPESLEEICDYAFEADSNLKNINMPNNIKKFGEYVFDSTAIEKVVFPEGIEEIGKWSFSYCRKLNTIIFSSTIKYIYTAFQGCEALEELTIPDTVEEIDIMAFAQCINLTLKISKSLVTKSFGTEYTETKLKDFLQIKEVIYI